MKLFRNSDFGTQKKSDIQNRLSLKPFCYIFGLPCMLNLWVSLKCTLSTLSISICEFSHSLIFKQSRRLGKLSTLWGNTELLVEWSNFQVLDMCHKVSMTDWPSLRHDICQQIYATAVFGPKKLRKKSINRDKIKSATKQRKCPKIAILRYLGVAMDN